MDVWIKHLLKDGCSPTVIIRKDLQLWWTMRLSLKTYIMRQCSHSSTVNTWNVLAYRTTQKNIYFIQNKQEHYENNLTKIEIKIHRHNLSFNQSRKSMDSTLFFNSELDGIPNLSTTYRLYGSDFNCHDPSRGPVRNEHPKQ